MPSIAPELPLSRWQVLCTDDPARACAHLSGLFRPHRIALRNRRAPIDFRHSRAEFGGLSLNALRYGAEITIDAPTPADSYLVKLTLRGASEVRQGRASYMTDASTMCVLNPTRALVDHMSADFDMLVVQLEGQLLRLTLAENFGVSVRQPLEFVAAPHQLEGSMGSFQRLIRTICEDLDAEATGFDRPQVRGPLVRTLASLLLTELPHNYSARLPRMDAAARPRHLRAVEDYIDAHLADPIGLDDLLAVAGTSARTLQAMFLHHHATTPMRFVRDRRLDRARAELLHEPDARVTDVALRCGFSHLGKFAQHYRERFGEPPSRTRTRSC